MTAPRMNRDEFPLSFGAWKPVDHVVVALSDDDEASKMAQALDELGFDTVLQFSAAEMARRLRPLLHGVSGAAGFGAEIEEMRRYHQLASEGSSWLVVYAPEEARAERVGELAQRHRAQVANKYHRLAIHDLLDPTRSTTGVV